MFTLNASNTCSACDPNCDNVALSCKTKYFYFYLHFLQIQFFIFLKSGPGKCDTCKAGYGKDASNNC